MGYRLWGLDISPQYSPLEAGLGRFVKLDKGEFLGRKALIAQKDQGLRFGLAGLIVDAADCDCHGDEPIYSGGHIVSSVESGGYGHTMQASLAYAYLPLDYLEAGTPLSVEILGEKRAATVTEQPPLLASACSPAPRRLLAVRASLSVEDRNIAASPLLELREQMYGEEAARPRGVSCSTATRRITPGCAGWCRRPSRRGRCRCCGRASAAWSTACSTRRSEKARSFSSTPWPFRCRSP